MRAGKFVAASEISESPGDGLFPCYGGNGLRGYTKSFTHDGKYSLIGRQGALCGNVRLFDGRFHATEHALVVTPNGGLNTEWLCYALGLLELNQYAIGQAQPGLSVQVLEKASIARPLDPAEQEKIADCLASLDELIAAQGRKVEALKVHKKGLMQQLFPHEDETLPLLRFPEFRDAPGWEQKRLEELAKRGSGHTPSKAQAEYYNGDIKWVSLADCKRLDSGFISDTAVEISEEGIAHSSAVLHAPGTVILSRDAGIGKSAVMKESMAVSQHFMAWTCNNELLSNWFLY